jgi:hypothetical protein
VRRYLVATIAAAALCLSAAPAASALQEVGNPCVADGTETDATMLGLSNQGSLPFMQPIVPPEGAHVITRWRVQVGAGIGPVAQQLIASHQVGEEDDRKVGESAVQTLVPGSNEFATRIPVSEYDHIGLRGPEQTLVCHQQMNTAGRLKGAFAIGETRRFEVLVNLGTPVIARVEPDRDGDGYGDETQDGCPWNAALQTECPPVTPKVDSVTPKQSAILVAVGVSSQATVQIFGQVSWQVRQKAGRGVRRARKGDRGLTVGLSAGAPRTVLPGTIASFRLPLTKAVLRRLGRLTPRQALRAQITIRTTDLAGRENDRLVTVKLRGRQR